MSRARSTGLLLHLQRRPTPMSLQGLVHHRPTLQMRMLDGVGLLQARPIQHERADPPARSETRCLGTTTVNYRVAVQTARSRSRRDTTLRRSAGSAHARSAGQARKIVKMVVKTNVLCWDEHPDDAELPSSLRAAVPCGARVGRRICL